MKAADASGRLWNYLKEGRIKPEAFAAAQAEEEAAKENARMLQEREQQIEAEEGLEEASDALVGRLATLRAGVAGQLRSTEEIAALRAALTTTFESFAMRRLWTDEAPAYVYLDLTVGFDYAPVPTLRPEAIEGLRTTSGDAEIDVPYPRPRALSPPATSISGGTSRYCSAKRAIWEKTGAATEPPQIAPFGSSTATRITSRGFDAGRNPTNEATYFEVE